MGICGSYGEAVWRPLGIEESTMTLSLNGILEVPYQITRHYVPYYKLTCSGIAMG